MNFPVLFMVLPYVEIVSRLSSSSLYKPPDTCGTLLAHSPRFLLSDVPRCSRLVNSSCPRPGISHSVKKPWSLLIGNDISDPQSAR